MKYKTGLVSISFRTLSCSEIITLCRKNRLIGIEWGGDIHVPAGVSEGDLAHAGEVRKMTRDAGLSIPNYGSYYRAGASDPHMIEAVAQTARALGAEVVRIWAFEKGSAETPSDEYMATVSDIKRICEAYPDLTFCTECHNNTLTDDFEINLRLIGDVERENFGAFWQPNQYKDHAYNVASAKALAPFVRTAHVFAWEGKKRYPLAAHTDRWRDYLEVLAASPGEVNLMLEFMHDDRLESLDATAGTLAEWIKQDQ